MLMCRRKKTKKIKKQINYKKKIKPVKKAKSDKHSDLYTDEDPKRYNTRIRIY